ncbi:PAS domain S-box protein [Paenibacillus silviterrae]|uniref:PAS domain S-box protein n=1 Tax=Paenibacillus silviterrae TaxID=3242194 RepID=UPI00254341F3|nr:PAS domain S-box protein [Paenibacillus chinjuensis]
MHQKQVNVLIVDDRPENLLAMTSTLQSPDYAIVTAGSGEEALRLVLKDDFALILMDVQMPGLNGFDTVKMIKSRELSKHIPVIFVTALSHATEHTVRGYEVGAIDFVFKPVHPAALKYKVEQFVQLYADRQRLKAQKELIANRTEELQAANTLLLETTRELRKMEALARVVGETSVDSILVVDAEGKIMSANPAIKPMLGYQPEELMTKPLSVLLPDAEQWFGTSVKAQEALIGRIGRISEKQAVRKDGSTFPTEVQLGEARIEDRSIYVCSVRDITERKLQYMRLEEAVAQRTSDLQEANARLKEEMQERSRMAEQLKSSYDQISDILESITDAFYALDANMRIHYLNGSAEKQIGVSLNMAYGRSLWDFVSKEKSRTFELVQRSITEQLPVKEELYSLLTGGWIEVRVYPTAHGASIYVTDTSEQNRMKLDVQYSQERFYKIFKASPSLMGIQSLSDHSYLDVNESWVRHTGYTPEELIQGKADLQLTVEPQESQGQHYSVDGEGTVQDLKVSYVTKAGEVRVGLLSTEIIETLGEPCVLTVITDITDRVELEREIARLDRLHMIGEMAAGIAHEIRNPMTTVRGFLQLMRAKKTLPGREILDIMVEELNRANGIITEFLALAKNKTTDRRLQSLNGIVGAIVPLIQAEATLAGKTVSMKLGDVPQLALDEKEIRQMILNLALNGLEAMEAGGTLTLATYSDGEGAMLEVRDQGHGMNPNVLQKLGTPFFTTKETGTGLGLAVCFSIAARHQARITWQTGEVGTIFCVRFPLHPGMEDLETGHAGILASIHTS